MSDPFILLLVWGAAALGFFLVIDGLVHFLSNTGGKGASRIERRLSQETATMSEKQAEAAFTMDPADLTIIQRMEQYIGRAGVKIGVPYLMGIAGLFSALGFGAYTVILPFAPTPAIVIMALVTGALLPFLYLRMALSKRMARFQEQFPDALDLIVRSLRVGHPISAAMENIADEMSDPIGHEFAIVTREIVYGKDVPHAIEGLLKRMNVSDVRFFVVAIQIHNESGGNLAEILAGLSTVIRSRFHLFRKVRALSVEGRFSAWFLSAFPVVMIFAMNLLQPGYYEKVSDVSYFDYAVGATFFMLVLNVIAMRMMTKLEV